MTLPPTQPVRMAAELKAVSQRRYGKPATEVDDEFLRMFEEPEMPNRDENSTEDKPDSNKSKMGRRAL